MTHVFQAKKSKRRKNEAWSLVVLKCSLPVVVSNDIQSEYPTGAMIAQTGAEVEHRYLKFIKVPGYIKTHRAFPVLGAVPN
jgi:hypothetical protein